MEGLPISRRLLLAFSGVLLLGVAVIWYLFIHDPTPTITPGEAQEKAAAFLDQIRTGRVDEAWTETSTDFKSMYGRERFRQFVRNQPVLRMAVEFESCEFSRQAQLRVVECTFRPVGGKGTIKVILNVDQGTWKVGRLHVE
jgi:hypothetical protein